MGNQSYIEATTNIRTHPLISNDIKYALEFVFQISTFITTSLFGVCVNVINIIVYKKLQLRDSITLGFFVLSISDLIVVFCPLPISAAYIAMLIWPNAPYDFVGFPYVSTGSLRQMAYSFSTLLTAYLSIERCCCVIAPFQVKLIFTRRRTVIILTTLLVFHIFCYAPVFATHQLRWTEDPGRNNTKVLKVWYAPQRQEAETFNFTTTSIITPALAQVIVICSSFILIHGLRASSKFRQAAASGIRNGSDERVSGLTNRDARLVKSMAFLGGILSACNLPYLGFICTMLLVPEINLGRAFHNTYSLMSSITFVLATVNGFSNVFVYYNTNSRYRAVLLQMLGCDKKEAASNKTQNVEMKYQC